MLKPNWILWEEERPREEGTYMTYWSDDACEPYPLDLNDLAVSSITISGAVLTHWSADKIAGPYQASYKQKIPEGAESVANAATGEYKELWGCDEKTYN